MATEIIKTASLTRLAVAIGAPLNMTITFPVATDFTGFTALFTAKDATRATLFTLADGAEISVASEVWSLMIKPATTGIEATAFSLVQVGAKETFYSLDLFDAAGDLYTRFQGEILWIEPTGEINV